MLDGSGTRSVGQTKYRRVALQKFVSPPVASGDNRARLFTVFEQEWIADYSFLNSA
jgi:hypothetical protein